jgi:methyl-accepting chemotaxis protein
MFERTRDTIQLGKMTARRKEQVEEFQDRIAFVFSIWDYSGASDDCRGKSKKTNYVVDFYELIALQKAAAKEAGKEARLTAGKTVTFIATLLGVTLTLGIVLAIVIIHSITTPVGRASALAETMAKGDFTTKLEINQKVEIGLMAKSLNSMVVQLSEFLEKNVGDASKMTAASEDLAAVSQQLSSVSRDTSEKADTVVIATEEMSTTIQSVLAAMEQSSANVHMVASATEEMSVTINEIKELAVQLENLVKRFKV